MSALPHLDITPRDTPILGPAAAPPLVVVDNDPRSAAPSDVQTEPAAADVFRGVEERLLVDTSTGDAESFRSLYDRFAPAVYGLAMRNVRDEHFAQEITQEVFLEVWRLAGRFDPARASARTFVLTIAHRRSIDRVRREQSARNRADREVHEVVTVMAGPEDDTIDFLHVDHERAAVRAALETLSTLQREAIELAFFHGLTYSEVAAYLDAPLGTVKSRIRDGLLRLRDQLVSRP